jgi:hypothetical protein
LKQDLRPSSPRSARAQGASMRKVSTRAHTQIKATEIEDAVKDLFRATFGDEPLGCDYIYSIHAALPSHCPN